MSESLRSVRWNWIVIGWFVAVAVTSLLLLALIAFGVIGADGPGETLWVAVSLLIGFFLAGIFVGTRVVAAPTIHGLGMTLFSIVAWLAVNLFVGEPTGETTWRSLDLPTLIGLLVIQGAAAIFGARIATRWMRTPSPALDTET